MAVFFALAAIPLLAVTSAAIDYSSLTKERAKVSGALDAAVLAAANNNAIAVSEKGNYAKSHFLANYGGNVELTLDSSATSTRVRLEANGALPLAFGNLIGIDNPKLREASAATLAVENTICVLALSEDDDASISFDQDMEFLASGCAVHSNSSASRAILVENRLSPPTASSFCAVGGIDGAVIPHSKGECRTVSDPYAGVESAEIGACKSEFLFENTSADTNPPNRSNPLRAAGGLLPDIVATGVVELVNDRLYSRNNIDRELVAVSSNLTGGDLQLTPGTYCGGLTVDGLRVRFAPGDYIFKDGPLTFLNESQATADRVTFGFSGAGATLNIESGSSLTIRSATEGPRKGLAFMQMIDADAPGNRLPIQGTNRIASGGSVLMSGTAYFPEQTLLISGEDTHLGANSPAVGLIADKIEFRGARGSRVAIAADHQKAGIPPIQPQVDDGVRLVE